MATSTAAQSPRTRTVELVRAVPMWAWVVGLVVVSAGIRYALARRIVAPWIMVDELVYSELAKSFADAGRFLLRGEHTAAYGLVYPAILSPAPPAKNQTCTQQYGGPQVATVTGVVDGRAVQVNFSLTNGCEIAAWKAAKDVLGSSGGAS